MFSLLLLLSSVSDSIQNLSIRTKRQGYQGYYYICGSYPNQYYSLYPCTVPSGPGCCSNGRPLFRITCSTNVQCIPFYPFPTICIRGCCCTEPGELTTTTAVSRSSYGYCYNGERSQMRCSSIRECSDGQTCINGLCCKTTGNEWQNACAGLTAISSCTNGTCGSFICTTSNYCCECEYGRTSGLCSKGCGSGYFCSESGYCCPSCPNGEIPYGSCYRGQCAAGYSCRSGNICCPE